MLSMERSSFLYISLIQITSHPLLLWKSIFIFFLPRITRFYTIIAKNFLGEDPQTPLPLHIYNTKSTMSYVCFCRERIAVVQEKRGLQLYKKTMPPPPLPKIKLVCSSFSLLLLLFFFFFFFFFAFQNFRKVGPPLTKFLDPRLPTTMDPTPWAARGLSCAEPTPNIGTRTSKDIFNLLAIIEPTRGEDMSGI